MVSSPNYQRADCSPDGTATVDLGTISEVNEDTCDVEDLTAACGYTITTLSTDVTYTLSIALSYTITYENFESDERFSIMASLTNLNNGVVEYESNPTDIYQAPGGISDTNTIRTYTGDETIVITGVQGGFHYELLLGAYLNKKTGITEEGTVTISGVTITATPE